MRSLFHFLLMLIFLPVLQGQDEHYCHRQHAFGNEAELRTIAALDDANIDIKSCWFDWKVDPNVVYIEGSAKILFASTIDDLDKVTLSLATKLKVDSIVGQGEQLTFLQSNNYDLTINLNDKVQKNELASITIYYRGKPSNNGFGTFSQGQHANAKIIWTFSVPFGSREWWPCKNGNSDKIDSIQVQITTPKSYKAASNGKLLEVAVINDSMHMFVWKHNYAIAPYLVAFAVTNYESYSDEAVLHDNTKMEVLNFVYPESMNAAKPGTKKLLDALVFFDSLLVRYPFINDKYGHAQFGWGGGMEHQTMSFVTNFAFSLLAHELAHQWFGDMVTCRSWTDVWLNEGFATYMEGLAEERFFPTVWASWKKSKLSNITSINSGAVYVKDSTNINRIFDGRLTYDKGAYLLHQLRWLLGDEAFFDGLRNYLRDRQYDFAATRDLQSHLEASSGRSLQEYFNDYFYGEGFPKYNIKWEAKQGNKVSLLVSQTQSSNKVSFFEMTLPIVFSNGSESKMVRLDHAVNNQYYEVELPFQCTKVEFDPTLWLISRFNTVTETTVSNTNEEHVYGIKIYPKPFNDALYIDYKDGTLEGATWKLYDATGKIVKSAAVQGHKIDMSNVAHGTYVMKVISQSGNEVFSETIVK